MRISITTAKPAGSTGLATRIRKPALLSRFDHAISAGIYCLGAIGRLMILVITAASSAGSTGLVTCIWKPAFKARTRSSTRPLALNLEEYRIVRARNFAEGLRFATEKYFDLYILNNWLPDGTGVDLCKLIRKLHPHTPILFCSAATYEADIREGMSAGAQAYFVKPIDFEELQLTVARLTNVAQDTALEARRAEIAAIREELADHRFERNERIEKVRERSQKVRERGGKAIDMCLTAKRKFLRLKAMQAYLAAGGTRGDFAREWLDEISPSRYSTPEPNEAKPS